jgi:uncharacterized protein (DUF2236 family)
MTVSRADLEAQLALLVAEVADPRHGLYGPGSSMWTVSRESIVFLGGGRAALLQLAHPWVAAAVKQHSVVSNNDLTGRFKRTFESVFAMVFGDLDQALGAARRVHELHETVVGPLEQDVGPWAAHERYHANDPAALLWVHASLVDTTVLMYEMFIAELAPEAKDRLWVESRKFARLFGIPDDGWPADWAAFRAYVDGVIASDVLTVSDAGRKLSRLLMTPPNRRIAPAWHLYAAVTAGLLPERLRSELGLSWSWRQRALYRATIATLRRTWRRLPSRLRWLPAYVDASRRLRGQERDPLGQLAERLVLQAMRQGA